MEEISHFEYPVLQLAFMTIYDAMSRKVSSTKTLIATMNFNKANLAEKRLL